mmetsp:Transcript_82829/g.242848  ORF Transcript_82829/g.242848 Transcript_82829/m.242848 type:complete len:203 (-) Transcript_82829:1500-2108(-)
MGGLVGTKSGVQRAVQTRGRPSNSSILPWSSWMWPKSVTFQDLHAFSSASSAPSPLPGLLCSVASGGPYVMTTSGSWHSRLRAALCRMSARSVWSFPEGFRSWKARLELQGLVASETPVPAMTHPPAALSEGLPTLSLIFPFSRIGCSLIAPSCTHSRTTGSFAAPLTSSLPCSPKSVCAWSITRFSGSSSNSRSGSLLQRS